MYEVSLKDIPGQHAAVVRFRAQASEMPSKMPAAYGEVMAFVSRSAISVEGPAIARFHQTGDIFDVEAGFYVEKTFAAGDGVACIELPAGEAAVTSHIGPYESLSAAYEAVQVWARENGRELEESMWEEYWSDPESTPPSEWRTDVIWPLKPRT